MRNFSFRFFVTLNEKDDVKIYLMKTNLQNQECQVDCQDLEPPFMHCPQIFFNIYKTFNLLTTIFKCFSVVLNIFTLLCNRTLELFPLEKLKFLFPL